MGIKQAQPQESETRHGGCRAADVSEGFWTASSWENVLCVSFDARATVYIW